MMQPEVSVIMITYGHEEYIEKAIESVFSQKTNFPVELIISNDCSPDNTDAVVKNTIQNSPENITVNYIRQEKNVRMNPNFLATLKKCKGKYVAICEGDDYWQDENKLQKQYDFMEQNPDFAMYFHRSEDHHQKIIQDIENKEYSDKEVLNNWYIHTASVLFRNDFTEKEYNLLASEKIHFYDIILFLIMANKGKIWGTNEKMSFYRYAENSITNADKKIGYYESLLFHLQYISEIYDRKYSSLNRNRVKNQAYKIFRYYAKKGNPKALGFLFSYLKA